MSILGNVVKFQFKKNLGKWAAGAGTGLVSAAVPYLLKYAGIELTPEQKVAVSAAIASGIVGIANALKFI